MNGVLGIKARRWGLLAISAASAASGIGASAGLLSGCSKESPAINSFTAMPDDLIVGANSALSWDTTNTKRCFIEPEIGDVEVPSGTRSVRPAESTIYSLTCFSDPGSPSATASARVVVHPKDTAVGVLSFTAVPSDLIAGETVTLTWRVKNAQSCALEPGIGAVDTKGTLTRTATVTTTFTLTCQGENGPAVAAERVVVHNPVQITSFVPTPSVVDEGGDVQLDYTVVYANACKIDPGVGTVPVRRGRVERTLSSTTTFRLECTGYGGPEVATATISTLRTPITRAVRRGRPNGAATNPAISASGRFVVFESTSSNVLADDDDAISDIYLFDRVTKNVELISVSGGHVKGNGASTRPSISADGNLVAFVSTATNLVASDTLPNRDVFVRNRALGTTEIASIGTRGSASNGDSDAPSVSGDGRFVAFESDASNLAFNDTNAVRDIFAWSVGRHTVERLSLATGGTEATTPSTHPIMSQDGQTVAFLSASSLAAGAQPGVETVFLRQRATDTTVRASDGASAVLAFAFSSDTHTLVFATAGGFFRRDLALASTRMIGPAIPADAPISISRDGRFISYPEVSDGLSRLLVHDETTMDSVLLSVSRAGVAANADALHGALSADGRYLAFDSTADNLVPLDTSARDVFIAPNAIAP